MIVVPFILASAQSRGDLSTYLSPTCRKLTVQVRHIVAEDEDEIMASESGKVVYRYRTPGGVVDLRYP
jgi:hypothetical protein